MAWVTPRTWATSEDITAARLNENRDAVTFLGTPPGCRVYNSAAISHTTSGTDQRLTYNSERYDTDTMHSTGVNTGRITATTAGKYLANTQATWAGAALGTFRYLYIRLNGSTILAIDGYSVAAASNPGLVIYQHASTIYALAATDYIESWCNQNTGAALDITAGSNYSPEFMAAWQSL